MASAPLSSPAADEGRVAARHADVLLAGAGLANSLIALRLKASRPALRIIAFDAASPEVEDPHTWSFFASDVEPAVRSWLEPLAAHRWDGYSVQFPAYARQLATPYASLIGAELRRALAEALGTDLRLGREIAGVDPEEVRLADGEVWRAPLVIDGRGARRSSALALAWQKFVGLELRLESPHGLERPIIMDATVEQFDGYRFVYVLPFGPDRLLVEDTYYSSAAALDRATLEDRALAYTAAKGWRVAEVLRREEGVLPLALGGDLGAFLAEAPADLPAAGLRAPLFNPVTGYSLPDAASLAHEIAGARELVSPAIASLVRARVRTRWREGSFLRTLNRMMFLAAEPERRYQVLERFYRLPEPLIERFYAGRPTFADRARILVGRPPTPVGRALKALPETAARRARA